MEGKYDIIFASQAEREKKALEEERLHEEKVFFVEQCQRLCKANMSLKEEVQHLMKEKEELKEKLEATKPQVMIMIMLIVMLA